MNKEEIDEFLEIMEATREDLLNRYITLKHVNSLNIASTEKLMGERDWLKSKLAGAESKLAQAVEVVRFYGDKANWTNGNKQYWGSQYSSQKNEFMHPDDYEDTSGNSCGMSTIGGKCARQAQYEVEEMIKKMGGEG